MTESRLRRLEEFGQSIWYDNIRRGILRSGELARLVEEDGISGVTSNPSIFEKAVGSSTDYDEAIHRAVARGAGVAELYEELILEDIRLAADILRPVHEATAGRDGYVSVEVAPALAHDAAGTVAQARELFRKVGRPNVMIKVPATPAGYEAIRSLTAEGVNVNATLIFSGSQYEGVVEAYLRGLEERRRRGEGVPQRIASVASVFVSRMDTAVDRLLTARDDAEGRGLLGRAAIANAKLIYQRFRKLFAGKRFQALGARVQRPLWASTSTKNPAYRDVRYVEELIGPHTVNTLPPETIAAFRDHGEVRPTLEEDLDRARRTVERLRGLGIDLETVGEQLLAEGVRSFQASFDQLWATLREKGGAA